MVFNIVATIFLSERAQRKCWIDEVAMKLGSSYVSFDMLFPRIKIFFIEFESDMLSESLGDVLQTCARHRLH